MSATAPRNAPAPGGDPGREVVVLVDGPWARRCYWRTDLEAMQQASRNVGYPDTHPAAVLRSYHPTDEHEPITADDPDRTARVYRFTSPTPDAEAETGSDQRAASTAVAAPDTEFESGSGAVAPARSGGGRVLVTGSRTWTDRAAIRNGLAAVWGGGDRVLVTGGCPTGADALAEQCWRAWGGQVETHPADWATHGRAAGPRRNAAMVAAGARVCVAFIRDHSRGASHLAGLATAAGIPVHRHEHNPAAGDSGSARLAAAAGAVPSPRRPLDDEITERERLHRIHHDRDLQHEQTAQDDERACEGALW